jgi:hypothetical protein
MNHLFQQSLENSGKNQDITYNNRITALWFFVFALVANIDRIILGNYAIIKDHDTFDSFWPYQNALADRLFSFQLPGWFPDYIGGMPFYQMDINWLSFPVLISGVLPEPYNLTILMMVQFFIAGFGTYLFLRYFFSHISSGAAILSGLIWAFGTFNLTYWRIFDLTSIPLILYCTDAILRPDKKTNHLFILLGLFVCGINIYFAKGAPFIAFLHIFIIYALKNRISRRKKMIVFLLFWLFVSLINLPAITTLLITAKSGMRTLVNYIPESKTFFEYFFHNIKSTFYWPLTAVAMNLGTIGTIIFVYACSQYKKWPKNVKKIVFLLAVMLIYVLWIDRTNWYMTLRAQLPLSEFRLSRLLLTQPFILLIICCAAMDDFFSSVKNMTFKKHLIIILVSAGLLIYRHQYHPYPSNLFEELVTLSIIFLFLTLIYLGNRYKLSLKVLFITTVLLIIGENTVRMNLIRIADVQPPSYVHYFQSDLFDKFRPENKYDYRIGFINWHPTVGMHNGFQVVGGYASQYPLRYAYYWSFILKEKETFLDYPFKAYLEVSTVIRDEIQAKKIVNLPFNVELLALNNTRYLFSKNEIEFPEQYGLNEVHRGIAPFRKPGMERFYQVLKRAVSPINYFVYEIHNYIPRVYVPEKVILTEQSSHFLTEESRAYFKNYAVFDKSDLSLNERSGLDRINANNCKNLRPVIFNYEDNQIEIQVSSTSTCLLVLTENYTTGWKAFVNEHPTKILAVNKTFRAVILQSGNNHVRFLYSPKYLKYSYIVSIAGVLGFIIISYFYLIKLSISPESVSSHKVK